MLSLKKHINNTDVAALFLNTIQVPCGLKVRLEWFNIVDPNRIFPICEDEVFIKNEDIDNWIPWNPETKQSTK